MATKKNNLSFVRKEMVEERPAPASTVGIIGWLRENLFSSVSNSIITLIALYAIYSVLAWALPWLIVPTWSGTSQNDCRDIVANSGLDRHHGGACWGVIRDRWLQLLYGFYPQNLYWRPNLSFVLLLVAIAPVLFTELPRKMLYFSAVYPFFFASGYYGAAQFGHH